MSDQNYALNAEVATPSQVVKFVVNYFTDTDEATDAKFNYEDQFAINHAPVFHIGDYLFERSQMIYLKLTIEPA